MLDKDLIKVIQLFSREVEPKKLLTVLGKIIDRYLLVTRITIVLEEIDDCLTIANISNRGNDDLQLDLNKISIDRAKVQVPISIILENQEIVFVEKINVPEPWENDDYLQKNNPENFIICPLKDRGINLGFIYLENYQDRDDFNEQVKFFLETIAQQVAITLINIQSIEKPIKEVEQRENNLRKVIGGTVSNIQEEFFTACAFNLAEIFNAAYIIVGELVEPNHNYTQTLAFLVNQTFIQNYQYPLPGTPSEIVIKEGKYQQFCGLTNSFPEDKILVELAAESYWGMAARDSNNRIIGYIAIINTDSMEIPSPEKELILRIFTSKLGVELERRKAEKSLEQQIQKALLLESIVQKIRFSLDKKQIFQTTVTQVGSNFGVSRCLIRNYINAPITSSSLVAEYYTNNLLPIPPIDIPVRENSYVEKVLAQDQAIAVNNIYQEPLLEGMETICEAIGSKSILAVRTSYQGKPNGIISLLQCDRFRKWTESEIELLEAVAAQVGIAIAQAQLLEKEQQQRLRLDEQNYKLQQEIKVRKEIERNLIVSQQRYASLATVVPVGIFRTDSEGNYIYVNYRWLSIVEITKEAFVNQSWMEAIHPEDRESIQEEWRNAVANHLPFDSEYRFSTNSGVVKWVFAQAIPEYDLNDNLLGYVGTITDITQLKKTQNILASQLKRERLLDQILQKIRQSIDTKHIFETAATQIGQVFQVSRCVIYRYTSVPESQLSIAAEYCHNAEKLSLFGWHIVVGENPHAQIVLSQDRANAIPDVYCDPVLKNISSVCHQINLKSMMAIRTSYQGEPNGTISLHQCDRFREWTKSEIELLEAVAAQVGIAIAHAQLLEAETKQRYELHFSNLALAEAKRNSEIANQAKSQFIANMSHELRTPLNAILGFSQLMIGDSNLDSTQEEYLEIINNNGLHLLSLINNILDISKIEAGKMEIYAEYFALDKLLTDLQEIFYLEAKAKNLELNLQINSQVPLLISTDLGKLRQILMNLLSNGIKFTNKGSVSLIVDYQEPESIIFQVQDTGAGIGEAELDNLFQPFVQTQTGKTSGNGTGLGLAISHSLVQLLGGSLKVESVVGKGTTFIFGIKVDCTRSPQKDGRICQDQCLSYKKVSHCFVDDISNCSHTGDEDNLCSYSPQLSQKLTELSLMSEEWLQQLNYAAIAANDQEIYDLIHQIPESYHNLADCLTEMVHNFALEPIINSTSDLLKPKI